MRRAARLLKEIPLTCSALLLLGVSPALAAEYIVKNTNDSGPDSLRAAIIDANANPGPDTISFDIPGPGVRTITVLSELPTLVDTVTIDGSTQRHYAGMPLIQLTGNAEFDGLAFESESNVLRAVNIQNFNTGVRLGQGGGNTIVGCYLGTDWSGLKASGNAFGIAIESSFNTIGGLGLYEENVISGNNTFGIFVDDSAHKNEITGNLIGTDATGQASLGNFNSGVFLYGGTLNELTYNVIAGNGSDGVFINEDALYTKLLANSIGTDALGLSPLANKGSGVFIQNASFTQLGTVDVANSGNHIAYNESAGVTIVGAKARSNTVRGNRSKANGGKGIDLGGNGATPNDSRDEDSGPNSLQNTPTISEIFIVGSTTEISGKLSSTHSRVFTVDLYRSPACLSASKGENDTTYLGSAKVTTDASGVGRYKLTHPAVLPPNSGVTAVATDAAGNTSEHGGCKKVVH
ncbi:NosD domain-containing protein [Corallococcus terminator]